MAYEYSPKAATAEAAIYDGLWKVASAGQTELSGAQAVEFFRKSGVDSGILKQIWGLCTPTATMQQQQFYSALRFITMVQNGDIPLSRERLASSASTNYGPSSNFPKFNGVQLPSLTPATTTTTTPVAATTATPTTTTAAAGPNYAITPEEHFKYFNLFKSYDTNGDGFLSGGEAAAVFAQSGLDQLVLRAIWQLADDDKDNQLSSKEFCVGFHLILCIAKKNFPLPPSLPQPLRQFLVAAPLVPVLAAPVAVAPVVVAPVAPTTTTATSGYSLQTNYDVYDAVDSQQQQQQQQQASSSKAKTPRARSASRDAQELQQQQQQHKQPSTTTTTQVFVTGLSELEENELTNTVSSIRDLSRKSLSVADGSADVAVVAASSLKLLLQRLAQEKIALTAAVETAETHAHESANRLTNVVEEIKSLQQQLTELRAQLEQRRSTEHDVSGKLQGSLLEKTNLLDLIAKERQAIAQLSHDIANTAIDVGKSEGLRAELDDRLSSLEQEKQQQQRQVSHLNNELAFLQTILANLHGDKDARSSELTRLKQQHSSSATALARERHLFAEKEEEVKQLNNNKIALETEKMNVLGAIAAVVEGGNNNNNGNGNGTVKAAAATTTTTTTAPVAPLVKPTTPTGTAKKTVAKATTTTTATAAPVVEEEAFAASPKSSPAPLSPDTKKKAAAKATTATTTTGGKAAVAAKLAPITTTATATTAPASPTKTAAAATTTAATTTTPGKTEKLKPSLHLPKTDTATTTTTADSNSNKKGIHFADTTAATTTTGGGLLAPPPAQASPRSLTSPSASKKTSGKGSNNNNNNNNNSDPFNSFDYPATPKASDDSNRKTIDSNNNNNNNNSVVGDVKPFDVDFDKNPFEDDNNNNNNNNNSVAVFDDDAIKSDKSLKTSARGFDDDFAAAHHHNNNNNNNNKSSDGFDDDGFGANPFEGDAAFPADFGATTTTTATTTGSDKHKHSHVHFAAAPVAAPSAKATTATTTTTTEKKAGDDGFEFAAFETNPFDDFPSDKGSNNNSSKDNNNNNNGGDGFGFSPDFAAFGSSSVDGVSPFEAFGDSNNNNNNNNKSNDNSGFDSW